MRESRTYGSVRGAFGNGRPYRDQSSLVSEASRGRGAAAAVISADAPRGPAPATALSTKMLLAIAGRLGLHRDF